MLHGLCSVFWCGRGGLTAQHDYGVASGGLMLLRSSQRQLLRRVGDQVVSMCMTKALHCSLFQHLSLGTRCKPVQMLGKCNHQ